MKILRINHIGIAPKNHDVCTDFFKNILKLDHLGADMIADQKVNVDFFSIGESQLETLMPMHSDSPISKFLDTKGGGIHHIALEVDNLDEWLDELRKKNVRLIDETPRMGAHNTKIIFIHPQAAGGILIELVQYQENMSNNINHHTCA